MCTTPTSLEEALKPALCPTCNELRPHARHLRRAQRQRELNSPTPRLSCTLCGRLAPKPGTPGHNPFDTRDHVCDRCTIGCLCKYNPARLRSHRLLTAKPANSTKPTATNPYLKTTTSTPTNPPPLITATPTPAPLTASTIWPIDIDKETKFRSIIFDDKHKDTNMINHDDFANPSIDIRMKDLRRLDKPTSEAHWLTDNIVQEFTKMCLIQKGDKNVGVIDSQIVETMRTKPTDPLSRGALLPCRDNSRPWRASRNHDRILINFNYRYHWTSVEMRRVNRNNFTLAYQDGYGTATYMTILEDILNATILKNKTGTLTASPGPTQDNPFDCAVTVCLKNYVLIFHPTPEHMDWPKLMKIPNIILQFRRFMLMSLCTGTIHNIFDTTSDTGLPISTRLQFQTKLPFRPTTQQLNPVGANAQALRRQAKRPLPDSNPVYSLLDSDDESTDASPPQTARRRLTKPPAAPTRAPAPTSTRPTSTVTTASTASRPDDGSSDTTGDDEDDAPPALPPTGAKRSIHQLNLDAPRNLNERRRRQKRRRTAHLHSTGVVPPQPKSRRNGKKSRQSRKARRKKALAPTPTPTLTPSTVITHPEHLLYRGTIGSTSWSGFR